MSKLAKSISTFSKIKLENYLIWTPEYIILTNEKNFEIVNFIILHKNYKKRKGFNDNIIYISQEYLLKDIDNENHEGLLR